MLNQSSEQPLLLVPKSHSDDTLNNNCHHNNLGQPKPGISCGNIASAVATKNKLRTLQLNSSVSTSSDNDLSPTTTDSTPTSSGNNSHGVASGGRSSPCSNLSSPVSVTDILNNNNNPASNANTSTKSTSNSTDKCNNSRALPEILENIAKTDNFLQVRHRWNTNEEIAAILIAFDKHDQWLSHEVRIR